MRGVRVTTRKALVTGWFSRENGATTAGDLLAREWQGQARFAYDGALAAPFRGGVDWRWPTRRRTRTP